MERIKEDRPITIKDDKGNLNRCIADVVSVRALCACAELQRGSPAWGLGGHPEAPPHPRPTWDVSCIPTQ